MSSEESRKPWPTRPGHYEWSEKRSRWIKWNGKTVVSVNYLHVPTKAQIKAFREEHNDR